MGALLQADVEALRGLGRSLAGTADAVDAITVTATVTMPGSPIAAASEQSTTAVTAAYKCIGSNVREMSTVCEANAANYEDVDHGFRDQVQRFETGAQP